MNATATGTGPTLHSPASDLGGVTLTRPAPAGTEILTSAALDFVARLHRTFEGRRQEVLRKRETVQRQIEDGAMPDLLPATWDIRETQWTVAPMPEELADRRVEITGPVDRKMIINALNSGAKVYMADFEDSHSPTWANCVEGQANLKEAVNRTIAFTSPEGKRYRLADQTAVLFVRPRGWHLSERHMLVDGEPVSGSLFDFGLFFFHNAHALVARGTRPYFYLPKLESHLEARLWNDVFTFAQDALEIPRGTIRATVLIENILAAFEMHEILWELRDHSAGLNCGRWDYIFSFIKKFRHRPEFVLPDRGQVTMDRHFLRSYVELLIQTCHRRGAHAMGGMAAQIPIKSDPQANERALAKVREDKVREVMAGHDGTWVAHPGLVPLALEAFHAHLKGPNQLERRRDDVRVSALDLLSVPTGTITAAGLRLNVDVGLQYLAAWLSGTGCVPIYHLMEDAATAEISRSQVWQWVRHGARLEDGRRVTPGLVRAIAYEELEGLRRQLPRERFEGGKFELAAELLVDLMISDTYPEWLTTVAYQYVD